MKAAGHNKNITLHSVHRYLLCFIYYLCSSEKQSLIKEHRAHFTHCAEALQIGTNSEVFSQAENLRRTQN